MPEMKEVATLRSAEGAVRGVNRRNTNATLPWPFVGTAGALVVFGLVVCYSATMNNIDYNFSRQLMGVIVGVVLMIVLWRFDYHQLSGYTTLFLVINVVLIMMPHIPFIGLESNGALSWVKLGPISFQPGEFAKITVILLAAGVAGRYGGHLDDLREYLKALVILGIPFVCIMTQPDMGTGLVYLFIAAVALIVGGARAKYLLITLGIGVALIVGVFVLDPILDAATGSDVLLKEYQRARLLVFMDSSFDPTGDGYNLTQAKIAIGSGGLFGKGFMMATQSTLGFLPESATDFVFCVLAEEFGLIGSLLLVGLYLSLIINTFLIARRTNDLFGTLLCMCVAGMWIFQIFENIGMTIGLMPITGIPLPFVSYGSSFMIVNFVCLGLIGSVWAHNRR